MPWSRLAPLLVVALLTGFGPASARAEPRSYALVIGSNRGGPGQPDLRYAARDAQRFAELLVELGRTQQRDVQLLLEPTPSQIAHALSALRKQLGTHGQAGESSKLIFYYSGHARARSLSLGKEELGLDSLRRALLALPSSLTIAILDACQSGAFSGIKGAAPAADFSTSSIFDLKNAGVAVMASSTGTELSQESPALRASYFTHHLITGLRGAGDLDRDGTVSIDEAYGYAYQTTLSDTARTRVGSQHATLETELRGHGNVPLTYTVDADALLQLPESLSGRVIVMQKAHAQVVAELNKARGTALSLALPHGTYEVLIRYDEGANAQLCDVALAQHARQTLETQRCRHVPLSSLASKLGGDAQPFERWFVEAGATFRFWSKNDAYTKTLRKFDFEDDYELGPGVISPQLAVGVGLLRYLSLLARGEMLEQRQYERRLTGPHTAPDKHEFSWSTGSAALGLRLRLPRRNEYIVPFVEFDVGLAIARSKYQRQDASRREHQFGPLLRADVGLAVHMFWRMGCYFSLGYDYAPVLRNDLGDIHDSGGFHLSTGLRLRGLGGL